MQSWSTKKVRKLCIPMWQYVGSADKFKFTHALSRSNSMTAKQRYGQQAGLYCPSNSLG